MKVTPGGEHSVFFKSDENHIRKLAFDNKGNLIAGSDGSGLVYRIIPSGEAFVLYSAAKREITALAVDDKGNIYAAGVGEKRGVVPQFGGGSSPMSGITSGGQPIITIGGQALHRAISFSRPRGHQRFGNLPHRLRWFSS